MDTCNLRCYLCNSSEIIILFKLKETVVKGGMESTDIFPKEIAKSLINGGAFFVEENQDIDRKVF